VRMQARVAKRRVQISAAVNPKVPGLCWSSPGETVPKDGARRGSPMASGCKSGGGTAAVGPPGPTHGHKLPCPGKKATGSAPAELGTVLQTDTGGWAEHAKANEGIPLKELGKLAPCPGSKGSLP